MASRNEQAGLVVLGSVFLGIWIYGILFGFGYEDTSGWLAWGVVGMVLAGAAYGIRAAEGAMHVALLAALGIVSTVVVLTALANEDPSVFGAVCTALGLGLVAAALPPPRPAVARDSEQAVWKEA